MYYRLSENMALRSWDDVEYAYYYKGWTQAQPLSAKQAKILLLCDGEHDVEMDETVMLLLARKLIETCKKGQHPSEWSSYRKYDNKYIPRMNFMITGKCNFNCLHCFNAADNAPLMTEWLFEDICKILDQAEACGIHDFEITGGEPMLHKRFIDIVREIYRRNMQISELNTNGYFLNQEIVDTLKEIGCQPMIKISFDGIGCHDWIRQHKGAEKQALSAMKLCVDNGFRVMSQTQVHRKNVETMIATAKILSEIGVQNLRMIRTTEVPRWVENAPDATLPLEEYYATMLEFAKEFIASGINMDVYIWQFLRLHPDSKSYYIAPVKYRDGEYSDNCPGCKGNRGMVAVTSSGEVVPCMQMSGYLNELGISFGNLHDKSLQELLISGNYINNICMTLGEIKEVNKKCANCKYFKYCTGGCRALGLLYSGQAVDFAGADTTKCTFFENGWYERVCSALKEWKNITEMKVN